MSLDGNTSTYLPYTLNGLSSGSFSNTSLGNATATTLQVTSATPNRLARFDANDFLVSASVDETDLLSGTLTTGKIPKATGVHSLADSLLTDSGTRITNSGNTTLGSSTTNSLYVLGCSTFEKESEWTEAPSSVNHTLVLRSSTNPTTSAPTLIFDTDATNNLCSLQAKRYDNVASYPLFIQKGGGASNLGGNLTVFGNSYLGNSGYLTNTTIYGRTEIGKESNYTDPPLSANHVLVLYSSVGGASSPAIIFDTSYSDVLCSIQAKRMDNSETLPLLLQADGGLTNIVGDLEVTGATTTNGSLTANNSLIANGSLTANGTITATTLSTATPSYTLGINGSNQIVKFANAPSGSISAGYIPYASALNVLANSLLYQGTNFLGIGTTVSGLITPPTGTTYNLTVNGSLIATGSNSISDGQATFGQDNTTNKNRIQITGNLGTFTQRIYAHTGASSNYDASIVVSNTTANPASNNTGQMNITCGTLGFVANTTMTGSFDVNQTQAIPTFPITGKLPSQMSIITGSQNLRIGTYYTGGVGSYSILQSTDYYSGAEHGNALFLNPLGGAVTINTNTPLATFHLNADGVGSGYGSALITTSNSGGAGGSLTLRNSGGGVGAFASLLFELDGTTSCVSSSTPLGYAGGNGMLYSQITGTSNQAKMGFIQWNGSSEVETLTILPSGNVGIGTTAPTSRLSIEQTLLASAISGTWSNIGVTMPCQFTISSPNGIHNTYIGSYFGGGVTEASVIQSSAFYSNSDHPANLLLNPNSGNVGVGIVSPQYKLDVAGSQRVQSGDNSMCYYGTNATWSATLAVGSGTNKASNNTGQIIVTNGNLHLDASYTQTNAPSLSGDMYYGYYANQNSTPNTHKFYGVATMNQNLSVSNQPYCMLYGASIGGVAYGGGTIVFYGGALLVGQSAGMTNVTGNGWDATNACFYAPKTGRYQVNISFYWNSFSAGSRFSLQHFNASNSILATRYCALAGAGFPGDTTQNYSMMIYMNAGDYVRVVCSTGPGGQLYFSGYDHTHASFTMIL